MIDLSSAEALRLKSIAAIIISTDSVFEGTLTTPEDEYEVSVYGGMVTFTSDHPVGGDCEVIHEVAISNGQAIVSSRTT